MGKEALSEQRTSLELDGVLTEHFSSPWVDLACFKEVAM